MAGTLKLIGWEFKKTIRQKTVIITLSVLLFVNVIMWCTTIFFGSFTYGSYTTGEHITRRGLDYIAWDKAICASFEGRIFDDDFILAVNDVSAEYDIAGKSIAGSEVFDLFQWAIVKDRVVPVGEIIAEPDIPARYEYSRGWSKLTYLIENMGIILGFGIIVCTAAVYAGEYAGADALLLTARYGKRRLAAAKFISALVFTLTTAVALLLLNAAVVFACYGTGGFGCDFRLTDRHYFGKFTGIPRSIGYAAIYTAGVVLVTALLVCATTLIISAIAKSSFNGIVIALCVYFGPNIICLVMPDFVTSNRIFKSITHLFPFCAVNGCSTRWFNGRFELFGLSLEFLPTFSVSTAIALVICFTVSVVCFSRHQTM